MLFSFNSMADDFSKTDIQSANTRADIAYAYTDDTPENSASLTARFTQVFGGSHQFVGVIPSINVNTGDGKGARIGDVKLGYSYAPRAEITANPWVPSEIGMGVGLSIPTETLRKVPVPVVG